MMRNQAPSRRFPTSFEKERSIPLQKPVNVGNMNPLIPCNTCIEDPNAPKKISCFYCGETFITKPGLKQHIREKCDRKNFMHSQSCHDCGESFVEFEHYKCHLRKFRHMTHRRDETTEFPVSAVVHPNNIHKSDLSSTTLYIGCALQKNSLLGACTWELHSNPRIIQSMFSSNSFFESSNSMQCFNSLNDDSTTVIAEGFKVISMEAPCIYRLIYESLILGITAALKLNVQNITIKLDSELVVYQLSSSHRNLYFSSLLYNYRHMIQEIHRLLSHFHACKFQVLKNPSTFSPSSSFSASTFAASLSSASTSSSVLSGCEDKAEAALERFDAQVTAALVERVSRPDLFWKLSSGSQDDE